MKVYIVRICIDDEYGCMGVDSVYAKKEDAERYVAENQFTYDCWYGEQDLYDIIEEEVL